jgi:hypothetical protein
MEPGGVWGAAWIADPAGLAVAALGAGGQYGVVSDLRLSAEAAGGDWRLDGVGAGLAVSPTGEEIAVRAPDDGIEGTDQLCHVTGRFEHAGAQYAVDCVGVRTTWSGEIDLDRYESIRSVSTWFASDDGLTLTAFRPRKSRSHDGDVVAASVIAPDGALPVEDPRLSTTYDEQGWPMRAGLELWLAGEEPERQYPRRASGEAAGARAEARLGELELRAEPFRWHSRDRDGAGVYLLARRA